MGIKIITSALIGFFMAPFFAVFATPVMALLRSMFYVPFIQKKLLAKAKENGHVIKAKLQKKYREPSRIGAGHTSAEVGIYAYEYNGRTKRYRATSSWGLSDTINLYYIKNPRKATLERYLGMTEVPWGKMFLLSWLILFVVFTVIGLVTNWQFLQA